MLKNILRISLLLMLSNCASTGSAFLGPVITGAKTGSVYQASLSYSSGKMINALKDSTAIKSIKEKSDNSKNPDEITQPSVLVAILTTPIEINDIFEEEPLP